MSTAPVKVTVLVTLYNKGIYVEEAVQSILAQTHSDFELLVVDDASTDGGLEEVRSITDARIRILESAVNTGRAAAANRGFAAAQGELVAVMDADDVMRPERLAKQVAYMDSHAEVGALGTWMQAFGGSDRLIRTPSSDREARALSLFGMPVMYGSCMLRRSLLDEHGLQCDTNWHHPGMDQLLMLRIGMHTQYANLQEVLTDYRIGAQNMRHGRNVVEDRKVLCQEIFKTLGIPATKEEADLQLFLIPELVQVSPNIFQVWKLRVWIKRLEAIDRQLGILPVPELEADLEKRWNGLFHRVVQQDAGGALMHMLVSSRTRELAGYWAKATKDRWLGRPQVG